MGTLCRLRYRLSYCRFLFQEFIPFLPGEFDPAIERCGSSFARAAVLESKNASGSLDDVAQTNLVTSHEAR